MNAASMPFRLQRIHLVLHQRNQRRDNQGQPVEPQRRQLIAQRLAPARRHQNERIPARQHAANNLFLKRQEFIISKLLFEEVSHGDIRVLWLDANTIRSLDNSAAERLLLPRLEQHLGALSGRLQRPGVGNARQGETMADELVELARIGRDHAQNLGVSAML